MFYVTYFCLPHNLSALGLNGYIPLLLNPDTIIVGIMVLFHTPCKRGEKAYLVITLPLHKPMPSIMPIFSLMIFIYYSIFIELYVGEIKGKSVL